MEALDSLPQSSRTLKSCIIQGILKAVPGRTNPTEYWLRRIIEWIGEQSSGW